MNEKEIVETSDWLFWLKNFIPVEEIFILVGPQEKY